MLLSQRFLSKKIKWYYLTPCVSWYFEILKELIYIIICFTFAYDFVASFKNNVYFLNIHSKTIIFKLQLSFIIKIGTYNDVLCIIVVPRLIFSYWFNVISEIFLDAFLSWNLFTLKCWIIIITMFLFEIKIHIFSQIRVRSVN